ncbi:MAG: restriction endonuclease [Rhizobacter sp.]|nr:restriction endonuclease [Rhizobacter sp.]
MASAQGRGILGRLADRVKTWLGRPAPRPDPGPPAGAPPLHGMGWTHFEAAVAEGFRHRGYAVSGTGGGGGRVVDMVLTRGAERFLVDCKPWRASAVGLAPVMALHGLMRASGAAGGFVLTSGGFTPEAERFAQERQIQLLDGGRLRELLRTGEEKTQPVVVRRAQPFPDSTLPPAAWRLRAQPCPLCAGPMVETERGGRRLLGCSHHPLCEGTRPL